MKISVVVPAYQHAAYIEAAIDSILSQEDCQVEVLVFDGGSKDGTVEILQNYGSKITWTSAPDGGQTDAINKGLHQASGEILAYLNSDDIYFPGALARVAAHFQDHPKCELLYGDAWHLHEDGSKMERYPTEKWDYNRLFETCFICQPASFWRRRLIERVGVFDERFDFSMDYEFWLRAGASAHVDYLPGQELAGSRLHADTKTLGQRLRVHHEILHVVRKYARRPQDCYHWLRHLAAIEANEAGFAASQLPAQQQQHEIFSARFRLTLAEQHQIELDEKMLQEIDMFLSPLSTL